MSSDQACSSISPLESAVNLKISERRDAALDLSSRRNSKEQQIRQDLLQVAIVDIYLNLKKEINKYSHGMDRLEETQTQRDRDADLVEKE